MLLDLLKNIFRGNNPRTAPPALEQTAPPNASDPGSRDVSTIARLVDNPQLLKNLQILYADTMIGDESFLRLYNDALEARQVVVPDTKWYRRAQRALHLSNYFTYSLPLPGASIECGILSGFSSWLLCTIADMHPDYRHKAYYMLDSFKGLSDITDNDLVKDVDSGEGFSRYKKGDMRWSFEEVTAAFSGFQQVKVIKGWIPAAFEQLPEQPWSFVHIDVDLYEPTLACLEYFYGRMVPGGVIINDDYASPDFPGGGKAWDDFCMANGIPVVALDTGQAVILKE